MRHSPGCVIWQRLTARATAWRPVPSFPWTQSRVREVDWTRTSARLMRTCKSPRVARVRGLSEESVRRLVAEHTHGRQFGILGEPRVAVLPLDLALDKAAPAAPSRRRPVDQNVSETRQVMRWLEYAVFLGHRHRPGQAGRPVRRPRLRGQAPTLLDPAAASGGAHDSIACSASRPHEEMTAGVYLACFLAFSATGHGPAILRCLTVQHWLPGGPDDRYLTTPMTPDLAANTALSFSTTTTWQAYGGETTLRYLIQVVGLASQNFLAGAAGLAVGVAFIRGFARERSATLGNFWVDLVRSPALGAAAPVARR